MLLKLEARVAELEKAVEQSAANHNAMVGMLIEAKSILKLAQDGESSVEVLEGVVE